MIEGKIWAKKTPVMLPANTVGNIILDRPYSIAVASLSGCLSFRVTIYLVIDPSKIVNPLIDIASFVYRL